MNNNEYKELFFKDSVEKKLNIVFDGGIITNAELHSNQFELTESICSEESLRFGGCEASVLKFKVSNIYSSLVGKELDVSMFINGDTENPYRFGKFKVYSDTPTADRSFKDIVAYDKMYDIINSDVAEWYNSLSFPMTLKAFRSSFVSHFGIEEVDVMLVNDDMMVEKTLETFELSGKDVARAICEINGCFGRINRENKFEYVVLKEMTYIYPSNILFPSNTLYSMDILENGSAISRSRYISCQYEDFKTHKIDGIDVYEDGASIGNVINDGENVYIIHDNFLIYGKSTNDLTAILTDLLGVISVVEYRPANIVAVGNPAISLGEAIRLSTKHQAINTYVLNRTISGIQGLRDNYSTSGVEYYEKDVNSAKNEIIKLRSKTNKLIRTVEETVSKIEDVEKNLSTEIRQTAEGLTVKIENSDTKAAEAKAEAEKASGIASSAKETADESAKYATNYLDLSSLGLIVGNMILDELGKNVLIGTDTVSIRDGDTILADYSIDKIRLGINSDESIIELCGGNGFIKYGENTITSGKQLMMSSNQLTFFADKEVILFGGYIDETQTGRASQVTVLREELHLVSAELENGYGVSSEILLWPTYIQLRTNPTGYGIKISDSTEIIGDGKVSGNFNVIGSLKISSEDEEFWKIDKYNGYLRIYPTYGIENDFIPLMIKEKTGDVIFKRNVHVGSNVEFSGYSRAINWPLTTGTISLVTASTGAYFALPYIETGATSWTRNYLNINPSSDLMNIGTSTTGMTYLGKSHRFASQILAEKGIKIGTNNALIESTGLQKLYIGASDESDYRLFLGVMSGYWGLMPSLDSHLNLGGPENRFATIYSSTSTITTSDRNLKTNIQKLEDKHYRFLLMLEPVSFKFIDGTSGRTHIGFISQDVEKTMQECGLTDLDFAGFCKDQKYENVILEDGSVEQRIVEGEYIYSLRYEEFIGLIAHSVQKLYQDLEIIKSKMGVI